MSVNYENKKAEFLDELQPDDFRNAGVFNQAEIIIEEISEGFYRSVINEDNSVEFINKAVKNLFREGSLAAEKMKDLANIYVKMKT